MLRGVGILGEWVLRGVGTLRGISAQEVRAFRGLGALIGVGAQECGHTVFVHSGE